MPGKYYKIIVPNAYREVTHPVAVHASAKERQEIDDEISRELPLMYFRGANTSVAFSKHAPVTIQKNGSMQAANPSKDTSIDEKTVIAHRSNENNNNLISLTKSPSVATFFASSIKSTSVGQGYVYCIQFESDDDNNFFRLDVDSTHSSAGEMEVFGVNGIKKDQIKAYYAYHYALGITEIYLSEDLDPATQEKIICAMVSGHPTSNDPAVQHKVTAIMSAPKVLQEFYEQPAPEQQRQIAVKSQSAPKQQQKVDPKPQLAPKQQQKVAPKPQPAPKQQQEVEPKPEKKSKQGLIALIGYGALVTIGVGLATTGLGAWAGVPLITAGAIGIGTAIGGAALGAGGAFVAAKITEKSLPKNIKEEAQSLIEESETVEKTIYNNDVYTNNNKEEPEPNFISRRSPQNSNYLSKIPSPGPEKDLESNSDLEIENTNPKKV